MVVKKKKSFQSLCEDSKDALWALILSNFLKWSSNNYSTGGCGKFGISPLLLLLLREVVRFFVVGTLEST
jgi:hypothetical protein